MMYDKFYMEKHKWQAKKLDFLAKIEDRHYGRHGKRICGI